MKLKEWLVAAGVPDAGLIALKFLSPGKTDRSWLVFHENDELQDTTLADNAVLRRLKGEPLAYIFGEKGFYGRTFKVSSDVLIPRPETEDLIDLALAVPDVKTVLDLGTGSGCIGITLKLQKPELDVTLGDISPLALRVAEENSKLLGAEVKIVQTDLLEGKKPDLVVANLPYVDKDWEWLNTGALAFEPALALFAGEGGLALYHRLFKEAKDIGVKVLIIEADPSQHMELEKIALENRYRLQTVRGFGLEFLLTN